MDLINSMPIEKKSNLLEKILQMLKITDVILILRGVTYRVPITEPSFKTIFNDLVKGIDPPNKFLYDGPPILPNSISCEAIIDGDMAQTITKIFDGDCNIIHMVDSGPMKIIVT